MTPSTDTSVDSMTFRTTAPSREAQRGRSSLWMIDRGIRSSADSPSFAWLAALEFASAAAKWTDSPCIYGYQPRRGLGHRCLMLTKVRHRRGVALAVLCLAAFTINLDTTIVNIALPSLVRQLDATTRELQWVVDAYTLTFAALVLAAGSLSDRYGRKGALLTGLAIFGTATA